MSLKLENRFRADFVLFIILFMSYIYIYIYSRNGNVFTGIGNYKKIK